MSTLTTVRLVLALQAGPKTLLELRTEALIGHDWSIRKAIALLTEAGYVEFAGWRRQTPGAPPARTYRWRNDTSTPPHHGTTRSPQ